MAAFPSYVSILAAGYSESFDPSVERTEMERGVPKQRLLNSQVLATISATLRFWTKADIAAFETWYFSDIKRIGWFTMTHPRTGQVISARFEGGDIGQLAPGNPQFKGGSRPVVIEYLR